MFLLKKNFWQVKKTAKKGLGIFTKEEIKKGTVIGDYLGKVIKIKDHDFNSDRDGLYLMYLTDQASVYPDLSKPGLHLINHSCSPNCFLYTFRGHTLFFALRNIKTNEELTISYLLSPRGESCKPTCSHVCKCESKLCLGTWHLSEDKYKKWQRFQNDTKRKTKPVKFTFGINLPKLASYPKSLNLPQQVLEIFQPVL